MFEKKSILIPFLFLLVLLGCKSVSSQFNCSNQTAQSMAQISGSKGLENKSLEFAKLCNEDPTEAYQDIYLESLKSFCFDSSRNGYRVRNALSPLLICSKTFKNYSNFYQNEKKIFCSADRANELLYLGHNNLIQFCRSDFEFNQSYSNAETKYCAKSNIIFFGKSGREYPPVCSVYQTEYACSRLEFLTLQIKEYQSKLEAESPKVGQEDQAFLDQEQLGSLINEKQELLKKENKCQ